MKTKIVAMIAGTIAKKIVYHSFLPNSGTIQLLLTVGFKGLYDLNRKNGVDFANESHFPLTLNSLGTVSFCVCRPTAASMPEAIKMEISTAKSLRICRIFDGKYGIFRKDLRPMQMKNVSKKSSTEKKK